MRIEYFVSYAHERGFGNMQIFSKKLLKFKDLKETQKIIDDTGVTNSVVISYKIIGFSFFKSVDSEA